MDKYELKIYENRVWNIAELFKNNESVALINKFYEYDKNWFIIYKSEGGQGTGFYPGSILQKIFIGDAEFIVNRIQE